jgi:hypothetical protein
MILNDILKILQGLGSRDSQAFRGGQRIEQADCVFRGGTRREISDSFKPVDCTRLLALFEEAKKGWPSEEVLIAGGRDSFMQPMHKVKGCTVSLQLVQNRSFANMSTQRNQRDLDHIYLAEL